MPTDKFNTRVLGPNGVGAEITNFAASEATSEDIDKLKDELAKHGVIALRDQDISPSQYVAFAKMFGEIEPSTREQYWLPEQNEIYVISNIVKDGRLIGNPNDGFVWHTDQYYFERPTAHTFLYGIETPPEGADTQYCSTRFLYDSMSEEEKRRLNGVSILASHRKLNMIRRSEGKHVEDDEIDKVPDVVHPLVRRHPISNELFLFFSADRASIPIDMPEDELTNLLNDLFARATRPGNVYSHKWKPRDLVIWDNRGLLHTATSYDKEKYRRLMYRISVIGERPYQ